MIYPITTSIYPNYNHSYKQNNLPINLKTSIADTVSFSGNASYPITKALKRFCADSQYMSGSEIVGFIEHLQSMKKKEQIPVIMKNMLRDRGKIPQKHIFYYRGFINDPEQLIKNLNDLFLKLGDDKTEQFFKTYFKNCKYINFDNFARAVLNKLYSLKKVCCNIGEDCNPLNNIIKYIFTNEAILKESNNLTKNDYTIRFNSIKDTFGKEALQTLGYKNDSYLDMHIYNYALECGDNAHYPVQPPVINLFGRAGIENISGVRAGNWGFLKIILNIEKDEISPRNIYFDAYDSNLLRKNHPREQILD